MTNYTAMAQEVEAKNTDLIDKFAHTQRRGGAVTGYLTALNDMIDAVTTDDSLGASAAHRVTDLIADLAIRIPKRIDEVIS